MLKKKIDNPIVQHKIKCDCCHNFATSINFGNCLCKKHYQQLIKREGANDAGKRISHKLKEKLKEEAFKRAELMEHEC